MASVPAMLVITGASCSGKSTLRWALNALSIPGVMRVECYALYDLGEAVCADLENAQDTILVYWVREALADPSIELAVVDTQIRPHRAQAKLQSLGISVLQVVLVACAQKSAKRGRVGRVPSRTWPIRRGRTGPPTCAGRRTPLGSRAAVRGVPGAAARLNRTTAHALAASERALLTLG